MLAKTRGIILHQIRYTDSGLVVQTYTRDFGRLSFLIKGMRSRKSDKHSALFQPMFILDLIFYYKESRSMQLLKEFTVSYLPSDICSDIKKGVVAIFLGEVLASVLREESPHFEMFDYIEESVKYFNNSVSGYSNFHIAFLLGLCSYLGFEPGIRIDENSRYFDLINGTFAVLQPGHGEYADVEISSVLARFFRASYDDIANIPLTGKLRNEVLETILRYYSVHLPGLGKIHSLEVLKEIFN
jgi:DNA repair protein RecO (recombination protein O)